MEVIDDQPMSASFFGGGQWLTDFITPEALDVRVLFEDISHQVRDDELIEACRLWVAEQVKYVKFVRGKLSINGKVSIQDDLWNMPSLTAKVKIGNCLGEGTKILVEKDRRFHIKKIEELANYNGYSAISYNFVTGKVELKPIIGWFNNGIREVVKTRFNNGERIQSTPDHLYFHDGKEIAINEAITGGAAVQSILRIPPLSSLSPSTYKYSPEHLWIIGMYLAEGYTDGSKVVICNDAPELISRLENYLDKLGVPHSKTNLPHSNYIRVKSMKDGNHGIRNLKQGLIALGHSSARKGLTPDLLSLGRPQLTSIMQGYCDGDGYLPTRINVRRKFASRHAGDYHWKRSFVLQYGTASELLADQLKIIHLMLGRPLWYNYQKIGSGVGKNPLPRHLLIEYKNPSYGKRGDFCDLGKLNIKEVTDSVRMPVYDIEVADNHNFMLASGALVHNCANKSFLLTSLLRNFLPPEEVFCVLGNLYNGKPGGHAWVEVRKNGQDYVLESTQPDTPIVQASELDRYEEVHYFNDQSIFAVPGKTVLTPFTACYSTWLKDYLNWGYIEEKR